MSRPRVNTEHGQYAYARREKCHCDLCQVAVRAYAKRRFYDEVKGVARRVDAQPVREHIQPLIDAGVTYNQIIKATDGVVTKEQVKNLIEGNVNWNGKEVTWLMPHTAAALMTVTYDGAQYAGFTYVDAIGVRRRLEGLRWMGYTLPALSEYLPMTYTALHHLTKRERVRTTTVVMIDDLYQKLQHVPGPDDRERWRAYRGGFVPPAAWEEHDIDDPEAEPDLSAIRCIVEDCPRGVYKYSLCQAHYRRASDEGCLAKAQKYRAAVARYGRSNIVRDLDGVLEDVRELRQHGYTQAAVADRLGRPISYISKIWSKTA